MIGIWSQRAGTVSNQDTLSKDLIETESTSLFTLYLNLVHGMKILLIWLIQGYRVLISPLLPPNCRFQPTCSQYAIEALERFGSWRGGILAVRRVLRCHPFHPGGYDPVPSASEQTTQP